MSKAVTIDTANGSERNLNEASGFAPVSPYEIYQQWEGIPVYKGFIIDDLLELELGDWARTGGKGAFVNLDGAGGTCDTVIQEIAPGGELRPQHHLYEEAVFILSGQGATTLWNEGGRKHTLEWQKGSLFSIPLNAWFQHFNAQGREPVRMISLTDATVIINRYRNLDYIFNNPFTFGDRYAGDANEWGKPGRYLEGVKKGRVWESNFIADLWQFSPKDYKERGGRQPHHAFRVRRQHHERAPLGVPGGQVQEGPPPRRRRPHHHADRLRLLVPVGGRGPRASAWNGAA